MSLEAEAAAGAAGAPGMRDPDGTAPEGAARLLITGANGFVGRRAMSAFARTARQGERHRSGQGRGRAQPGVVGLGRGSVPEIPPHTAYSSLDLLDGPALARFVAGYRPTHILHLAGLSSVHQAMARPAETWRGNLVSLLNLCEAVVEGAAGATFLFVSSGEVYGRAFLSGEPVTEAVQPLPANGYARTKYTGEQMLCDILPAAGVKTIVLRPFNHIGPGQDDRFVAASFAGQIARIEAGRAAPVLEVGDLSARRDFLDVDDVIAAYGAVIAQGTRLPAQAVYNISSGRPRPISDILDGLRALSRVPFDVRTDAERLRPSEVPTASGDASALARAVGWQPRIAWEDTLARILDDARARVGPG